MQGVLGMTSKGQGYPRAKLVVAGGWPGVLLPDHNQIAYKRGVKDGIFFGMADAASYRAPRTEDESIECKSILDILVSLHGQVRLVARVRKIKQPRLVPLSEGSNNE